MVYSLINLMLFIMMLAIIIYIISYAKLSANYKKNIKEGFGQQDVVVTEELYTIGTMIDPANFKVTNLTTDTIDVSGSVNIVPEGTIIMWYGEVGAIPIGWLVCDGKNGTPDLSDRFLLGSKNPGQKGGGNAQITLEQLPVHSHTYQKPTGQVKTARNDTGVPAGSPAGTKPVAQLPQHGSYSQLPLFSTTSLQNPAGMLPFCILPPYYTLIYLIKSDASSYKDVLPTPPPNPIETIPSSVSVAAPSSNINSVATSTSMFATSASAVIPVSPTPAPTTTPTTAPTTTPISVPVPVWTV